MKISTTGGIIAAANPKLAFPLKKVGTISAVKRIALLFKQAGVFPIVVLTNTQDSEVRYQLSKEGVIFLPIAEDHSELIESAKIGFTFLKDICERIIFTPVNAPLFSADTVAKVMATDGQVIIPSFQKQSGHPIVIDSKIIDPFIAYEGEGGLKGAFEALNIQRTWVDVVDSGIVFHNTADIKPHSFHLVANLVLEKDQEFFSDRAKLLLFLISQTHGMRSACDYMALSYSNGWTLVNQLEKNIGFSVVQRKHGGSHGGRTQLTDAGFELLVNYQKMEEAIICCSQKAFDAFSAKLPKDTTDSKSTTTN